MKKKKTFFSELNSKHWDEKKKKHKVELNSSTGEFVKKKTLLKTCEKKKNYFQKKMTRVCSKLIETVEIIFLGTGEHSPEIRTYLLFQTQKSDVLWWGEGGCCNLL